MTTRKAREILKQASQMRRDGLRTEALALLQSCLTDLGAHTIDRAAIYGGIGDCLRTLGNKTEAKQYYRRAIQTDPANIHVRTSYAVTLLREHRFEEAEEHLRFVLSQSPNATPALTSLTKLLIRTGRIDEGLDYMKRTLEIEPNNPRAQWEFLTVLQEHKDQGLPQTLDAVRARPFSVLPEKYPFQPPTYGPGHLHPEDRQP
jgi:tetratricopeptide (TPR) repeat protein